MATVTATTEPVRLPPGSRIPKPFQALNFLASKHGMYAALARRCGGAIISVNLPGVGHAVVIGDPVVAKRLLSASTDLIERPPSGGGSLGDGFGPGSTFSLAGDKLLARRKIVLPIFHGKRMRSYESIIEEEVMREIATWPEDREFATLPSMTSITIDALTRALFGDKGLSLDELRELLPPMVTLVGLVLVVPPRLRRDLGRWSPWGRYLRYRRRFDAIVDSLIAEARADPDLEERSDVLALLLRARYEDGEPISDRHIADEMLTLLVSGHETTAGSLAWAVERLRRYPRLLARLTEEVDAGGSELRQATISEVQRIRPVLDAFVRRTKTRIRLGDWVIPEDTNLVFSIPLVHASEENFPDAASFNPDRFVGAPKPGAWIPFGGGVNRCVGAAFASMEMDITLRVLLREFRFAPTDAPGERGHWRGVANVPARGARAVVYRRTPNASSGADSALMADHGSA
ncbi:MAG TPA: cytochrome P450 [Mycobacterium sp.]|nr:cytochrome P450 [Mycobacterium sp.]